MMYSNMRLTIMIMQLLSAAGAGLREGSQNRYLTEGDTLSVKSKTNFGADIKVDFILPPDRPIPDETYRWIGIYMDNKKKLKLNIVPDYTKLKAWLNDCDTQGDCDVNPVNEGTVTFSGKDPQSYYVYSPDPNPDEYYYAWAYDPLRNSNYVVCYLEDTYKDDVYVKSELITNCKRLKIKPPKGKMTSGASIERTKANFKQGQAITANFETPVPIVNQWVGLYPAKKGGPPKGPLSEDADVLWTYTSCDTHDGDQIETSNCVKKLKKGDIKLDESHLSGDDTTKWPLKKGKYYLCINFQSNVPYNKFVCSTSAVTIKPRKNGIN